MFMVVVDVQKQGEAGDQKTEKKRTLGKNFRNQIGKLPKGTTEMPFLESRHRDKNKKGEYEE